MKIDIPSKLVKPATEVFKKAGLDEAASVLSDRTDRFGVGDSVSVTVSTLGDSGLAALYDLAKAQKARGLMMEISSYRNILAAPGTAKVGSLKALSAGLVLYFQTDLIDGWLYERTQEDLFVPWLIRSVRLTSADRNNPATVLIKLAINSANLEGVRGAAQFKSREIRICADAIVKKTIPEILAAEGFFHESEELKASYEQDIALFRGFRSMHGKQFSAEGQAMMRVGYRQELVKLGRATRLVNDEELVSRTLIDNADADFWRDQRVETGFDDLPFHCYLWMFHLGLHENMWVHVSFLRPYAYDQSLREKLILPQAHRDLVDILTTDMDVMMEDIVEGKSGGTTILCKGGPGLGKTLTAEVYSEVIEKPLYRVHSGQLGIAADDVEKNLSIILKRAARWSSVLLIDECDVFVRRRENDIHHNAVVASFLRTLEYFDGLLFLTTNRSEDIDDAILSRCIAVINYEAPDSEAAARIWNVLSTQFEIGLDPGLIKDLVAHFPQASGRDIKELLKLSSKFARRKEIPLDIEVFRQCAMFRGLAFKE